jgi:hypothetical protein
VFSHFVSCHRRGSVSVSRRSSSATHGESVACPKTLPPQKAYALPLAAGLYR